MTWGPANYWTGVQAIELPSYSYDPYSGLCYYDATVDVDVNITLQCSRTTKLDGCLQGVITAELSIAACDNGGGVYFPSAGSSSFRSAYLWDALSGQDAGGANTFTCGELGELTGSIEMRSLYFYYYPFYCMRWDYDLLPWGGTPPGRPGNDICWDFSGSLPLAPAGTLYFSEL